MPAKARPQGPWLHRFLIWLFSIALAVLVFWLVDFVIGDIGTWPGPDYGPLETERLDRGLVLKEQILKQKQELIDRHIADETEAQRLLRDSTENSQQTMNQLLEFQRLNLQKDVKPAPEEQQALADAERRFLKNQQQYQQHNEKLGGLSAEKRALQTEQEQLSRRLAELREPIQAEYQQLVEKHALKVGMAKLAFLLPLMLVTLWVFFRYRTSPYAPMMYAFGTAVLLHVALVINDYFPARYFKYVVILVALAVVVRILVHLLRMVVRPQRDWLLRQYREAYEVFLCPVCEFPIRRGPLRYRFWTRRSLKKLALPAVTGAEPEEPYVCPACATSLFEKCGECGGIRPSLLPTCQHCGNSQAVESLPVE